MFKLNGTTSVPKSVLRMTLDKVRLLFSSEILRLSCCCWGKAFVSSPALGLGSHLRQVAQCYVAVAVGLLL